MEGYLCPEAQIQDALTLCGAIGLDLNHAALFVAGDDVHLHPQTV